MMECKGGYLPLQWNNNGDTDTTTLESKAGYSPLHWREERGAWRVYGILLERSMGRLRSTARITFDAQHGIPSACTPRGLSNIQVPRCVHPCAAVSVPVYSGLTFRLLRMHIVCISLV